MIEEDTDENVRVPPVLESSCFQSMELSNKSAWLAREIIRISPYEVSDEEAGKIHGFVTALLQNDVVSDSSYTTSLSFYKRLVKQICDDGDTIHSIFLLYAVSFSVIQKYLEDEAYQNWHIVAFAYTPPIRPEDVLRQCREDRKIFCREVRMFNTMELELLQRMDFNLHLLEQEKELAEKPT